MYVFTSTSSHQVLLFTKIQSEVCILLTYPALVEAKKQNNEKRRNFEVNFYCMFYKKYREYYTGNIKMDGSFTLVFTDLNNYLYIKITDKTQLNKNN